jgi:hypothetical protein
MRDRSVVWDENLPAGTVYLSPSFELCYHPRHLFHVKWSTQKEEKERLGVIRKQQFKDKLPGMYENTCQHACEFHAVEHSL